MKNWNDAEEDKIAYGRFFANIKYICDEKGLNLGDVERKAGVSQGYLSRIRNTAGKGISLMKAYFLAKQVGETLDDLLSRDIDKEQRIKKLEEELRMLKGEA